VLGLWWLDPVIAVGRCGPYGRAWRIADTSVPVEYGGLTGERLDLPTGTFDAALSTWTLCTIPNLEAALAEIRRVLKPGGSFHFVEHGHAPDQNVVRWRERLEP
jgi:ubiquinone/menaquinone biosynthesis C-methylase UbiE